MEDKLVKYHHKALYFYFKKIGICFSVFLGTSVLVAIPISIAASIRTHQIEQALKEKEDEEKDTTNKLAVFEEGNKKGNHLLNHKNCHKPTRFFL